MADKLTHQHHDLLGYVPRPRSDSDPEIDREGLRTTGDAPGGDGPPILAVGDSFTFGDEVDALEAWPAQLQALLGRRVLNGGVTGYGLDQTVLRAEQLVDRHAPRLLLVGFIADDVNRTEWHRLWAHPKPWFDLVDRQLVLRGVPVPRPRYWLPARTMARLEAALTWVPYQVSALVGYHARAHPAGTGLAICRLLVDRLATLQRARGVRVILVGQYDLAAWSQRRHSRDRRTVVAALLEHARQQGLATIDTYPLFATEPAPLSFYRRWHLDPRGNRKVAGLVAATLRMHHLPEIERNNSHHR